MGLNKHVQSMVFDTRMMEWGLRHGLVTQAEVTKHLAELADDKDRALPVDIEADNDPEDKLFS